jgi:hypothetical protein
MRSLVLAALTFAVLGNVAPVSAQGEEAFYTGTFTCDGATYQTDWRVAKGLEGGIAATVYYQQQGDNRVRWIDLNEKSGGSGNTLNDANGDPRLGVSSEGHTVSARWLKGAPDHRRCEQFTVEKTETPRARFDKLFSLMEEAKPTAEQAAKIAEMREALPVVYILPELDQNAYQQRLGELQQSFWSRYAEQAVTGLADASLGSPEGRKQFASLLTDALSGPLSQHLGDRDLQTVYKTAQQTTDHYMASAPSAESSARDLYAGGTLLCERLNGISKYLPGYDFRKVELAAGLSTSYWSRETAEETLQALRACGRDNYASELAKKWPQIQQEQQISKAFLAEQVRLLSMPLSIETLVETNNLTPNKEVVQAVSNTSIIYDRYFGQVLDKRRQELMQAGLASIGSSAGSFSLENGQAGKDVGAACEKLSGLRGVSYETRDAIRQTCRSAEEVISKKAAAQAVEKVDAAFEKAEPGTDAAKLAAELCRTLPDTLPYNSRSDVYQLCEQKGRVLEEKEAALKCEQAITSSGADDDMLDSTIEVFKGDDLPIRDLVCKLDKTGLKTAFDTSGFLMWKKQTMTLFNERNSNGVKAISFVLKPSDKSATWVLAVENEETKAELEREKANVEMLTACWSGSSSCRY